MGRPGNRAAGNSDRSRASGCPSDSRSLTTSNTGAPGGGNRIRLRGTSSILGNATPLYVVDGVITSDVGGLSETVRPGVTGLLVPPEDEVALASAIVEYFEQGLAARLRTGVEQLRASHSWSALAEQAISLADELNPSRGWR